MDASRKALGGVQTKHCSEELSFPVTDTVTDFWKAMI